MTLNKYKIGILTFHHTLNYGAALQSFALCFKLRSMGYFAEIIDYRCDAIEKEYFSGILSSNISIKSFIKKILSFYFIKKREAEFTSFLKDLCSGEVYNKDNVNLLNRKYDVFISGSDQVWNLELSNYDWTYFLDFVTDKRKVSYAASFGDKILNQKNYELIKRYIMSFDGVSVREDSALDFLKNIGVEKECEQVLDPTFLLTKEEWIKYCYKIEKGKMDDEYILIYAQGRPEYGIEFAKKLKNKYKCKIIIIHGYAQVFLGMKNIRGASIEKFLNLIYNAKYVVTTSFHGMALSIIMHKSFFYEIKNHKGNINTRLDSLAKLLELENRRLGASTDIDNICEIDWNFVDGILNQEREKALKYLQRNCC